jgi:hypothetical protein
MKERGIFFRCGTSQGAIKRHTLVYIVFIVNAHPLKAKIRGMDWQQPECVG